MELRFWHIFVFFVVLASCSSNNRTIKIKGSDTEVNLAVLLAEQFHTNTSKLLISVSGGGSGLGIASLLNNNADIANSSRSIKQTEIELFKQKDIPLDSFVFAQDAIAFLISDKLAIDSMSTETIAQILNGKMNNWFALTNKKNSITIYGRQSNSGTYDFIKNKLHIHFSPYAKQMNGNAQILESLKQDNSGFGYVSAGYILKGNTHGLKILKVYSNNEKAISPLDAKAIATNNYYFQRPLLQYYRKKDYIKLLPFLAFEKSAIGKKIIQKSGYYPVNIQP